jgi:hypothetical protein
MISAQLQEAFSHESVDQLIERRVAGMRDAYRRAEHLNLLHDAIEKSLHSATRDLEAQQVVQVKSLLSLLRKIVEANKKIAGKKIDHADPLPFRRGKQGLKIYITALASAVDRYGIKPMKKAVSRAEQALRKRAA